MRYSIFVLPIALSGCAGVSFNQLNPDLSAKSAPQGAVYYLPKPILIVTADPKLATGAGDVAGPGAVPPPAAAPAPAQGKAAPGAPPPAPGPAIPGHAGGWGAAPVGGADEEKPKEAVAAPAGGGGDQSFSVAVPGYTLKLVYIPDRSRPMRLSVHAGFGTASLKPTLQNGWMLTGFDASADSKASEMLASIASLVTAAKGPAAAAESAKGGGLDPGAAAATSSVLRPGMYDLRYDDRGNLLGLCPLSYFTSSGPIVPESKPTGC